MPQSPMASDHPAASAEFMRRAIHLALDNIRAGGGPFGAVIAKNARIIAEGANRVTATNDPTAHAEIVTIREACRSLGDFQLVGCDLYTTCEPCPMCLGAIYWARPARVFYAGVAADAADWGYPPNHAATRNEHLSEGHEYCCEHAGGVSRNGACVDPATLSVEGASRPY